MGWITRGTNKGKWKSPDGSVVSIRPELTDVVLGHTVDEHVSISIAAAASRRAAKHRMRMGS